MTTLDRCVVRIDTMRTRRSWLLAATSLRPLAGLLAIGVFSAACGPSNPGRIDDNAVYFNCLEQFVERLRQSTCRVDVDSGSIEEVYAESIITWGPSIPPDRRHIRPRQRSVLFCLYWLDLDSAQTAERLGISVRSVQREAHIARRRMKALLT